AGIPRKPAVRRVLHRCAAVLRRHRRDEALRRTALHAGLTDGDSPGTWEHTPYGADSALGVVFDIAGHQGCTAVQMPAGGVVVRRRGAFGQRVAVLPEPAKGTPPWCRGGGRAVARAPPSRS